MEEPMEIQEHINASEQPLPVYVASAASKSVEKYQCNTVAIEVPEAAAEKERSHSGISKATEPLAANGVVEPNKTQDSIDTSEFFSDEQRFDHEVLSPTLLWDDIETQNETEEQEEAEKKEEKEEQLQNSTTVHSPSQVCMITEEDEWVNVHSNPATIQEVETENENDFVLVNLIPLQQCEVPNAKEQEINKK